MLWILLLVLVLLVAVTMVGGFSYRSRAGAGAAASPQTTIIERGHSADVSRRTESTTVTRETEVVDE